MFFQPVTAFRPMRMTSSALQGPRFAAGRSGLSPEDHFDDDMSPEDALHMLQVQTDNYLQVENYPAAAPLLEKTLIIQNHLYVRHDSRKIRPLHCLGKCQLNGGDFANAVNTYQRLYEVITHNPKLPGVTDNLNRVKFLWAMALINTGSGEDGEFKLLEILDDYGDQGQQEHPVFGLAKGLLEEYYTQSDSTQLPRLRHRIRQFPGVN